MLDYWQPYFFNLYRGRTFEASSLTIWLWVPNIHWKRYIPLPSRHSLTISLSYSHARHIPLILIKSCRIYYKFTLGFVYCYFTIFIYSYHLKSQPRYFFPTKGCHPGNFRLLEFSYPSSLSSVSYNFCTHELIREWLHFECKIYYIDHFVFQKYLY